MFLLVSSARLDEFYPPCLVFQFHSFLESFSPAQPLGARVPWVISHIFLSDLGRYLSVVTNCMQIEPDLQLYPGLFFESPYIYLLASVHFPLNIPPTRAELYSCPIPIPKPHIHLSTKSSQNHRCSISLISLFLFPDFMVHSSISLDCHGSRLLTDILAFNFAPVLDSHQSTFLRNHPLDYTCPPPFRACSHDLQDKVQITSRESRSISNLILFALFPFRISDGPHTLQALPPASTL